MAIFKSKTSTKDGRKWYYSVCYISANGERNRKKSKLYITKPEAQEAERLFLSNINSVKIKLTLEEMYYQYIDYADESIKGSTKYCKKNRIKNHILNYFGKMNIHKITINTILAWKSTINNATYSKKEKKYLLSYKRDLMKELRLLLNYGVDFCGLKENVASKINNFQDKNENVVPDEDKIRYITPNEYNLFISVIENIVFKTFFAFLYYMGVRKGEAQALTWEDIDFERDTARIIKTITNKTEELNENGFKFKITNTKNRKNRTIKIPLTLKNLLIELYQYYIDFESFEKNWFVFGGDRHLASQSIDNVKDYSFNLVKEKYGREINRITNHEFRHSHASYLISQGVKIERIAYRLGDTVGVVQSTYAHLFPEVEDDIICELDLIENNYKIDFAIKKEFLENPTLKKILYIK